MQQNSIGIIGLGVISRAYLDTLLGAARVRIAAVADLDADRARAVSETIPGSVALTVDELIASPEVGTVLNLTTPDAHAPVALAALAGGKGVYGEKPLASTLADAKSVLAAAGTAGLGVGCAPDTVLGTGIQTARAAIEGGRIGRPVSASATWVSAGHEWWHPQPDFYYRAGGGPLLDMGPYYITSLLHLLGPVVSVFGASSRTRSERTIGSGPRAGEQVPVHIDTHVTGVLEHADGALSTVTFSFDAAGSQANPIEVHGEAGSLAVPDPNTFAGDVLLRRAGSPPWELQQPSAGYADAARGVGLIDFLARPLGHARAGGDIALHALEVMTGLLDSAVEGTRRTIDSTFALPDLVPLTSASEWKQL